MNAAELRCRQIEAGHPGYRVWVSSEGWWYASRVSALAAGPTPTVFGAGPDRLIAELAADAEAPATRPYRSPIAVCEPRPAPFLASPCEARPAPVLAGPYEPRPAPLVSPCGRGPVPPPVPEERRPKAIRPI